MKKPASVLIALALVASLATASLILTGCGGNTAQAKNLSVKANEVAGKMNDVSSKLTTNLQALFSQTSSGALPDAAKFETGAKDMKTQSAQVAKDIAEIRTQYGAIKKLNDAEKYKQFADIQLQILDLTEKSIKAIDTFLDSVSAMITSGTLTKASFNQAKDALFNEVSPMGNQAQKLSTKAKDLREKNKLF